MEHVDVELLQNAPTSHMQNVLKARNISAKQDSDDVTAPLPLTPVEMAQSLFNHQNVLHVIESLGELEVAILKELVACGGRANSRDLALYFSTIMSAFEPPQSPTAHSSQDYNPISNSSSAIVASTSTRTPTSLMGISSPQLGSVPPQYPVPHPHGLFEQAVRHLLLLGLLFWGKQTNYENRDYASGIHDGLLIVPEAVRASILQKWGTDISFLPFTMSPSAQDEMEDTSQGTEGIRTLQRALYLYWSLVASQRDGLSLVNTGLLTRASLRQVIEHVGDQGVQSFQSTQGTQSIRLSGEQIRIESDAPYLLFLRLLLMRLGLLQERSGAIYAVNAEPFFALPLIERARRCYDLWYKSPFWNEMLYLLDVNVRPGPAPLDPAHDEVIHGRQAIIECIEHEQLNSWHMLSTFIARTKLHVPYLLFPRHYGSRSERYTNGSNPYGWDFRLKRGWLTHREGWHMVEGGFIRSVVTGPLHWLGVVEIDSDETPTAFRLTFASRLLLKTPPPRSKDIPTGRLIVQPNFELVVLAPVSEALLIALDRFAERVSLEHIAQYRLTKASVTHAIQMGLHAEDIQHTLEQAAGGEIPQNIHYSLAEWERQARRIEVWTDATLLEVDDPTFLDMLFADDEMRTLLRRRLAPRLAEVSPSQLEKLQELLWQRDYLPPTVSAPSHDTSVEDAVCEPQWKLHDDGLLQPLYTVTDLYLAAQLERFSESDEPTGWRRITAPSLQQALAHHLSLESIIQFLNRYCRSASLNGTQSVQQSESKNVGVPSSFLIRLKLWGGGYGQHSDIAVEQAPMLRLSPEVLADLLADSELAALLNGEVEQQQRLVRVQPDALERIIALLRDRGFSVE